MGGLIVLIFKKIQMDLPFINNTDISNEESVKNISKKVECYIIAGQLRNQKHKKQIID